MKNDVHCSRPPGISQENSVNRMMQGMGRKFIRYVNRIYQ